MSYNVKNTALLFWQSPLSMKNWVKQAECPFVSPSKTLWQLEGILIDTSLLFWAPSWKTDPHQLIYPASAVSVLRSPELVCQSAQSARPRVEVSFISRPPHRTNIRGPYLPGTDVPPRPSGEPVQEHIRSVYSDENGPLGVTVWLNQVLVCNDHHRVAVHTRAWWFFLHYCVRIQSRLHWGWLTELVESQLLCFPSFSILFLCHLFGVVLQVSISIPPPPS